MNTKCDCGWEFLPGENTDDCPACLIGMSCDVEHLPDEDEPVEAAA